MFSGGRDFEISMDFRTDQLNALLLFTYNTQTDDYMLVWRTNSPINYCLNAVNTQLKHQKYMTTCDILFIGVYFQVELEGGLLSFILASEGHVTELSMWVGLSYCDGDWKPLSLAKRGSLISAAVNDWAEETRGGAVRLRVNSPLLLGGVPTELIHPALDSRSHRHGELCCIYRHSISSLRRSEVQMLDQEDLL